MRTLSLPKREIDLAAYKIRSAQEADASLVLDEPFVVRDVVDGLPRIAYLELGTEPDDAAVLTEMWRALPAVPVAKTARSGGLKTQSRIFGYRPATVVRNDYCSAASLALDRPDLHDVVASGARVVAKHYQRVHRRLFDEHARLSQEKALPDYQIEGGPFTSGIVNRNNPLLYHFDRGNYAGVWSGMLVFKRHVSGGWLAMPEYDLAVKLKDRSLFLFDGQSILHGVTPIRLTRPDGLRFTVVYYSLRGIWQCLPPGAELDAVRRRRQSREQRMLAGMTEAGPPAE